MLKWLHEQFLLSGCFHHINHVPRECVKYKSCS